MAGSTIAAGIETTLKYAEAEADGVAHRERGDHFDDSTRGDGRDRRSGGGQGEHEQEEQVVGPVLDVFDSEVEERPDARPRSERERDRAVIAEVAGDNVVGVGEHDAVRWTVEAPGQLEVADVAVVFGRGEDESDVGRRPGLSVGSAEGWYAGTDDLQDFAVHREVDVIACGIDERCCHGRLLGGQFVAVEQAVTGAVGEAELIEGDRGGHDDSLIVDDGNDALVALVCRCRAGGGKDG